MRELIYQNYLDIFRTVMGLNDNEYNYVTKSMNDITKGWWNGNILVTKVCYTLTHTQLRLFPLGMSKLNSIHLYK
jgi:hypothetical protein